MGGVSGGAAARVRARGRCCSACTLPVSAPPPRSPPWCRESRSPHQRQATLRGYGRQCGGCRRALCSAIVRQCAADHARAPCSPPPPRATYVELWVEDVNALKEVRKGQVSRRALVDARCTHESAGAPSRRPPPPPSLTSTTRYRCGMVKDLYDSYCPTISSCPAISCAVACARVGGGERGLDWPE